MEVGNGLFNIFTPVFILGALSDFNFINAVTSRYNQRLHSSLTRYSL